MSLGHTYVFLQTVLVLITICLVEYDYFTIDYFAFFYTHSLIV